MYLMWRNPSVGSEPLDLLHVFDKVHLIAFERTFAIARLQNAGRTDWRIVAHKVEKVFPHLHVSNLKAKVAAMYAVAAVLAN